jgi:hypothetical protein
MSTGHEAYIHKFAGESSLRCTCGAWKGRNLVDAEGHQAHAADMLAARPTDTRTTTQEASDAE